MCELMYVQLTRGTTMTTAPPSPPGAGTDPAAFVAALRRLKAWSGLSYRTLERRAADAGHVLPYSTAATMLGRDRLPRVELVAAFVAACGVRGAEAEAWVDARRCIAAASIGPMASAPVKSVPMASVPMETRPMETAPSVRQPPSRRPRRPRRSRRWALAGAAAALLTALLGGTPASGLLTEDEDVRQTRTAYEVTEAR
ncbi:hypothetical protein [Streptomyces sp. NPDC059010]|uniref:hypothetical protein n=1 Tax=Streptomyces sp. NPDC059010 TaxID=3346695 RepID=UPI0036BAC9CF